VRGISKPWPGRDVYPDGHEAASTREAEDAYLAALPNADNHSVFPRWAFDGLDKDKLRSEMYREQRSLCIFCERRIGEGHPAPRIDHGTRSAASRGSPFTGKTSICPAPRWRPATRQRRTIRSGGMMSLTCPGQ